MREPNFERETPLSTATRAAVEAVAWVSGPWAAAVLLGWWAVPIAIAIVVGVPILVRRSVPFSVDPPVTISTPGLIRVSLMIDVSIIAIASMWYLLGETFGVLTIALVFAAQIAGWRRTMWWLTGAPPA
ncbi:MAG: hypothetical protein HZA58_06705 [Acidimicrobiia bacterium]|nr:hypothetical protein [Acidimicrobiia bacterium]